MKSPFIRLILVALLFINVAAAQTAAHDVSGMLGGTLHFVPFGTGIYDVNALGVVAGQVKSLGLSNVFTFHQPTPQGTVINGHFWIVAANGDKIQGTYEGTTGPGSAPNQLIGKTDFQISGGTGRFANASGTIHATAYVTAMGFDVFDWPVVWVLEGTINY